MNSIGIVIISHAGIADEMIRTVHSILSNHQSFEIVSYDETDSTENRQEKIKEAIHNADRGKGALLLCDLAGATPCNVCRCFLEKGRVSMVTGYNLPMIIKLASLEKSYEQPEDLGTFIQEYGQRNITLEQETE